MSDATIQIGVETYGRLIRERDERRALLAKYRAAIEAADAVRYQASNFTKSDTGHTDYALTEAIEDYDTARSALPDRENPNAKT